MSALIFLSIALFIWAALATAAFFIMRRHRQEALAELEQTAGWVHHNLRAIRTGTEYAFPEAVSLCNSLEMAFPLRARVDVKQLDRHLTTLRREHNVRVLDGAGLKPGAFMSRLRFLVAAHLGVPESALDIEISDGLVRIVVVKS